MQNTAQLLASVADLLWPILAFVVFFCYREQIRNLLARLKRGKLFGQEIELREGLDQLERSAEAALEEAAQTAPLIQEDSDANMPPVGEAADPTSMILKEAARSPRAAILMLSTEIQRELEHFLGSTGLLPRADRLSQSQGLQMLSQKGYLPKHLAGSILIFMQMRNKLVHGGSADDDSIFRALDSGITILRVLRALPREQHWVTHTDIELFSNPDLTKQIDGVSGVILSSKSAGGTSETRHVFPTTRTDLKPGVRVAWQWDLNRVFGEAWFRDPRSGRSEQAWHSSGLFMGRPLDNTDAATS